MTTASMNDWSVIPSDNTNIAGDSIAVGWPPGNVGTFARTIMAQIAYAVQGTGGAIPATWNVGTLIANQLNVTHFSIGSLTVTSGITVTGGTLTLPVESDAINAATGNAAIGFNADGMVINLSASGNASFGFNDATQNYAWSYGGSSFPMTLAGPSGNLIITGTLTQGSDRRIKRDIKPISPSEGTRWLLASTPVEYTIGGQWSAGFIAQEQIAAGFSKGITHVRNEELEGEFDSPDKRQFVLDMQSRIAYLTAALQDALGRIDRLERR